MRLEKVDDRSLSMRYTGIQWTGGCRAVERATVTVTDVAADLEVVSDTYTGELGWKPFKQSESSPDEIVVALLNLNSHFKP
jgi:hypothetical protein